MAVTTKRGRDGPSLKDRLVAVGERIVETGGLEALTLRAVARAANVSHMAPYRHFEDKDALLAAIAARGFHRLTEAMDRAGSQPDLDKGLSVGAAYVLFACRHPSLYRLMFGAGIGEPSRFPELAEASAQAYARCVGVAVPEPPSAPDMMDSDELRYRTIATWSRVHGLATLLIDGMVTMPDNGEDGLIGLVRSVLKF